MRKEKGHFGTFRHPATRIRRFVVLELINDSGALFNSGILASTVGMAASPRGFSLLLASAQTSGVRGAGGGDRVCFDALPTSP